MKDTARHQELRGYAVVTVAYWAFMFTDGALRMLVLLHFHALGFSPILLAYLFVLYEFMGMVTNILAGWLGTRYGLRLTLIAGLALQIASLLLLSALDTHWSVSASVVFVMLVQALSGVAKDLTKTSAKSAVKQLASNRESGTLFRWVAVLTGSKNVVKGLGFFLGGLLLAVSGFEQAVLIMAGCLCVVFIVVSAIDKLDLGVTDSKVRLREVWFTSQSVKALSSARVFLFGARDTWFVVAIPVYLHTVFTQTFSLNAQQAFFAVGAFLSVWVMGYGFVQAKTPQWLSSARQSIHWCHQGCETLVCCFVCGNAGAVIFHLFDGRKYLSVGICRHTGFTDFRCCLRHGFLTAQLFDSGADNAQAINNGCRFLLYVERRRSTTGHLALRFELSVWRAGAVSCDGSGDDSCQLVVC